MGQYLKGNNMAQIKIHNGRYYAHAQTSNVYNFCRDGGLPFQNHLTPNILIQIDD